MNKKNVFQWRNYLKKKKNHLNFPYEKIHHSFKKHIKKHQRKIIHVYTNEKEEKWKICFFYGMG